MMNFFWFYIYKNSYNWLSFAALFLLLRKPSPLFHCEILRLDKMLFFFFFSILFISLLISELIQFTQPVFVSREDPNSRINTIKEIKKRAHSKGAWPQVVIFPEGTCTNRSCLIGFKPGMFQCLHLSLRF